MMQHPVAGLEPAAVPQRGRDRDAAPGRHGDHAVGSRRATTTPALAVSVSRSPGCHFRTWMITWPVTRPEASTRLIP